jgi:hypothetical protein
MSHQKKFHALIVLNALIFLFATFLVLRWYNDERAKAHSGPFEFFLATPSTIGEVNDRIRIVAATKKRGLLLQQYLQIAGFDCKRTFRQQVSRAEQETWDKSWFPGVDGIVGCNYSYQIFGAWGAVFGVDQNDEIHGLVKVYNGSRIN